MLFFGNFVYFFKYFGYCFDLVGKIIILVWWLRSFYIGIRVIVWVRKCLLWVDLFCRFYFLLVLVIFCFRRNSLKVWNGGGFVWRDKLSIYFMWLLFIVSILVVLGVRWFCYLVEVKGGCWFLDVEGSFLDKF